MASYQVLVAPRVLTQLQDAPPRIQGVFDGILAFLRVDPKSISVAFPVIAGPEYHTIVFADGYAFLNYQIVQEERLVVLFRLVWLGDTG